MATGHDLEVRFASGNDFCAGTHFVGTSDLCVVMAGGLGLPRIADCDRFAARLHAAGHHVLTFDYRRLGDSGGSPRHAVRAQDQLADWDAAIECAASLPGVRHLAAWGFSLSGGHLFEVARRHPYLIAAMALSPTPDGPAATRNALRFQRPMGVVRFAGRVFADVAMRPLLNRPIVVPLAGAPGEGAVLTTPDADNSDVLPGPWPRVVAAGSAFALSRYRPARRASQIRVPMLIAVGDDDTSAPASAVHRAAAAVPTAELLRVAGNHYAPFLEAHEEVVAAMLHFLGTQHDRTNAGVAS